MTTLTELLKDPTPSEINFAERYSKLGYSGQRERNFEAFAATGLPTRRVEAWKWSDLRFALSASVDPADISLPDTPFATIEDAVTIRFAADGIELPEVIPAGLSITTKDAGNALPGAEEIPVAALAAALATKPGTLLIEVKGKVSVPLHLVFENSADQTFSHTRFVMREDAELTVYESHLGGKGFSNHVLEYSLEQRADLTRVLFQNADSASVQVFTAIIQLEAQARLKQSSLGFGAKLCRNETRIFHQGDEAHAVLNAAYLLDAGRHYDQTSLVRHSREACTTRQLVKGVVKDEGRAVFQGKFHVARAGQQTDAEMQHHALILENGGEVNAKPELEIYADDVQCAHGNTVGALDGEALFYIRQRGVLEKQAKALLTEAFLLDALGQVSDSAREPMSAEIRYWLESYV